VHSQGRHLCVQRILLESVGVATPLDCLGQEAVLQVIEPPPHCLQQPLQLRGALGVAARLANQLLGFLSVTTNINK